MTWENLAVFLLGFGVGVGIMSSVAMAWKRAAQQWEEVARMRNRP